VCKVFACGAAHAKDVFLDHDCGGQEDSKPKRIKLVGKQTVKTDSPVVGEATHDGEILMESNGSSDRIIEGSTDLPMDDASVDSAMQAAEKPQLLASTNPVEQRDNDAGRCKRMLKTPLQEAAASTRNGQQQQPQQQQQQQQQAVNNPTSPGQLPAAASPCAVPPSESKPVQEAAPTTHADTDAAPTTQPHEGHDHPATRQKRPRTMLLSPAWREGALAAAELAVRKRLEVANEGDRLDVLLQQVNYSQESVKGFFRDGRPVAQMRRELQTGEKSVAEIPMISAVLWNGRVYSADNRRLWTFKNAGIPHDSRIPVVVGIPDSRFQRKFSTASSGLSVRKRGEQGFFDPAAAAG